MAVQRPPVFDGQLAEPLVPRHRVKVRNHDFGENAVDDGRHEGATTTDVPVEGGRVGVEVVGDDPHREPRYPHLVEHLERGIDHRVRAKAGRLPALTICQVVCSPRAFRPGPSLLR